MAKKTKKMAFGGSTGPMDRRPPMQSGGNSKAGAGQSVKQESDRPDKPFGFMRGNRRGDSRSGEGGRGGRDDGPSMIRPTPPSGLLPFRAGASTLLPSGPGKPNTSTGPQDQLQAQRALEMAMATRPGGTQMAVQAPAGAPFKPGLTFDPSLASPALVGGGTRSANPRPMTSPAQIRFASPEASADYIKQYNEYMAQTGGKQYNPGYAKGGAVKPKKMASGGEVKGSGGGRGWGMARGSKSCKVR